MTKAQLRKFIVTRNKSYFSSNLQFQIDCEQCGFRLRDLGPAKKVGEGDYVWETPHGLLREYRGRLTLETENASAA